MPTYHKLSLFIIANNYILKIFEYWYFNITIFEFYTYCPPTCSPFQVQREVSWPELDSVVHQGLLWALGQVNFVGMSKGSEEKLENGYLQLSYSGKRYWAVPGAMKCTYLTFRKIWSKEHRMVFLKHRSFRVNGSTMIFSSTVCVKSLCSVHKLWGKTEQT